MSSVRKKKIVSFYNMHAKSKCKFQILAKILQICFANGEGEGDSEQSTAGTYIYIFTN